MGNGRSRKWVKFGKASSNVKLPLWVALTHHHYALDTAARHFVALVSVAYQFGCTVKMAITSYWTSKYHVVAYGFLEVVNRLHICSSFMLPCLVSLHQENQCHWEHEWWPLVMKDDDDWFSCCTRGAPHKGKLFNLRDWTPCLSNSVVAVGDQLYTQQLTSDA